jgi:PAS domain S-box-containing protein/putative nucleotidyltransferase with HDIG domain
MSDALKKLQHELEAAQRALAEAEARYVRQESEHQSYLEEVEKARKQIEQAHQEWMAVLDAVEDPIFVHDKDFHVLRCNKAYQRSAGISFKQIIGQPYYEVFPQIHAPLPSCRKAMGKAVAEEADEEILVGDISYRSRVSSIRDERGVYLYSVHILEDITERKRIEQIALEEKTFSDTLIKNLPDIFFLLDSQGCLLQWNERLEELLGLSSEALLGINALTYVHEEDRPRVAAKIQQIFATGSASVEARMVLAADLRDYLLTGTRIKTRFGTNLIGFGLDITERKRAQVALEESEEKFRAIFDRARDGIIVMNIDTRSVNFANRSMEQMLGYGPDELIGLTLPRLHPPEALEKVNEQFERDVQGGQSNVTDMPMQTKDGHLLYADLSGSRVEFGGKRYQLGVFRDATARRASDQSLRRANRALQTLSAGNMALVQANSEDELLQTITSAIVKQGGYVHAAVDYAEDDPEKRITPKAWSGFEDNHYWAENLSWADTEHGQLPIAKAIRSGETQVCHDIASDPGFKLWRNCVTKRGYVANIALPMSDGKRIFGGLCIYASDASAFDDEEVRLLEELANDLAYGIVALRTRNAHEQQAVILRQSLKQSIQTIADTVEARDPYTAGHQRRVAELATAIATEMGLPEDQINGIHLAGIIHDLGKIHVPAEILSKPGKLTDIEYELIKTHPQDGYDILKDVKFPWPIADIIRQHHERLDGSGYPQGLRGDAILLEARIMAVADVVEAMSSHRPYRPGLGIDAALNEIILNRATHFDPQVVDVCVALFREKNYVIPD